MKHSNDRPSAGSSLDGSSGFALILVLLLLGLLLSLAATLSLAVVNQGQNAAQFGAQMSSLIVAANGIEYARCVLPSLVINETLTGEDGRLAASGPGWRNPMSIEQARRLNPVDWRPETDDGIPVWRGTRLLSGCRESRPGYFALRVSNNAEEPSGEDEDGVVIVRSMGIVPERSPLGGRRNSACLIEAVFRQERQFEGRAALTLFGEDANVVLEGESSTIDGGEVPAVALVSAADSARKLRQAIEHLPGDRVSGGSVEPSVVDLTIEWRLSKRHQSIFSSRFWAHLIDSLPQFADTGGRGIGYVDGGIVQGPFHGVLITRGDVEVDGAVDGLLLHIGNGKLLLGRDAMVRGAVWMANVDCKNGKLEHRPVRLHLAGSATIRFDAELADEALSWLPPTQLGWRILFSEMPG